LPAMLRVLGFSRTGIPLRAMSNRTQCRFITNRQFRFGIMNPGFDCSCVAAYDSSAFPALFSRRKHLLSTAFRSTKVPFASNAESFRIFQAKLN
jgi:hypothetical protein